MASYVYVKNPNGTTYAYKNVSYWDKEDKKTKHRRKCVGKIDPNTKEIIPTGRKVDTKPEDALQKIEHCKVLTIGPALLLDKATAQTRLAKALRTDFRKIISVSSHAHITLQAKGRHSAMRNNGQHATNIPMVKNWLTSG